MTSFKSLRKDKKLHPAFDGLTDRQMASIYKEDRVRQLQAGECLFSEGAADRTTYLVINGRIQIQQVRKGRIYPVTIIEDQGLISRDLFVENGKRIVSAIAKEPVTAFVIDDAALGKMDQKIQTAIYKNLERQLSMEINNMFSSQADYHQKNTQMSRELTELLLSKTSHYSRSGAVQSLLKRVPKLPPYASRLSGMLLCDDVSTKDVAELAKLDPSLTGAVLKTVNSSYYGLSQKVTDFQHASLLLGFTQIYQIIVNLGIQNTMPKTGQFKRLQSHCVLISVLCSEISQVTGSGNGPVMNTIGLLHDIGKSVLLLLISQNPKLAFFIGLLDQAQIGALLLKDWEIPDDIYEALEYQNYPELVPPEAIPESCRIKVAILYVAHLCQDYLMGKQEADLPTCFLPDYFRLLNIRETTLDGFVKKKLIGPVKNRLPTFPKEVQEFFAGASSVIGEEIKLPKSDED